MTLGPWRQFRAYGLFVSNLQLMVFKYVQNALFQQMKFGITQGWIAQWIASKSEALFLSFGPDVIVHWLNLAEGAYWPHAGQKVMV